MTEAVLLVNGQRYGGWKTVRVSHSMRAIASKFSVSVSERYPGDPGLLPIRPGDEAEFYLGGQRVLVGHVDSRDAGFDAGSHTVSIAGRSKAADIVDCAPELGTYEFNGLTALQIAQRVAAPFGVTVEAEVAGLAPLDRFDIQPGETAFETIDRACKLAGVLPVARGDGGVVLTRESSAQTVTQLVEGENVKMASLQVDHSSRYARYIVAGQHFGTDTFSGFDASGIKAEAVDGNIRAARATFLRVSSNLTQAQAKERAQWEAANRSAVGTTIAVSVAGWQQANGALWPINRVVRARIPTLGVNGEFVIADAVYSQGAEGTQTDLTLAPRGAFIPQPEVPEQVFYEFG